jgi:hypothetical protein
MRSVCAIERLLQAVDGRVIAGPLTVEAGWRFEMRLRKLTHGEDPVVCAGIVGTNELDGDACIWMTIQAALKRGELPTSLSSSLDQVVPVEPRVEAQLIYQE